MTSQELQSELDQIKDILIKILSIIAERPYRFSPRKPLSPSIYAGSFSLKQAVEEFTRTGNYEPIAKYAKKRAAQLERERKISPPSKGCASQKCSG